MPPPLQKYANSSDENAYTKAFISPQTASNKLLDDSYISVQTMENLIKELQVHIFSRWVSNQFVLRNPFLNPLYILVCMFESMSL